jgi:hypothetical protein
MTLPCPLRLAVRTDASGIGPLQELPYLHPNAKDLSTLDIRMTIQDTFMWL